MHTATVAETQGVNDMKLFVGALAVAVLVGCASTDSLLNDKPSGVYSTTKSPQQYAKCVVPKWQNARRGISSFETEEGFRVVAEDDMNTNEVLDIAASGAGSKVSLYQRMPWSKMPGRGAIEAAVSACI
jgi:hypothetical protein